MLSTGTLSAHMAQHILLMSVIAPVLAWAITNHWLRAAAGTLAAATMIQIGLLWFWHAPPILPLMHVAAVHVLMQGSLLLAATWFWAAVFSARDSWRPIFALLVTSKLFCLLGVLLVFAPRPLYAGASHHQAGHLIADQQLAGLLMIVACPLTYLLAGIICAARWFASLERMSLPAAQK